MPDLVGIGLKLIGLLFLGIAAILFSGAISGALGFLAGLAAAAGAGLSSVIGLGLLRLGKQVQTATSRENAARDKRPPVIYLRSFAADTAMAKGTTPSVPFLLETVATEEEQLKEAIFPIGPLVGLGDPHESLPTLGASRTYSANEDWRSAVTQYLNRASLVLIRIGATDSLLWEVEQAVHAVDPRRLVLLIPNDKSEYDKFVEATHPLFPCALPEYPKGRVSPSRLSSVRGLIYFTDDWQVRTINLPLTKTMPTFFGAFTPVFNQLGLDRSIPWWRWLQLGMVLVVLVLAIAFLVMGYFWKWYR